MTNEQQQLLERIGQFLEACRNQTDGNLMRQTTAGPELHKYHDYHGLGSRPEPHDHSDRNSEVTNAIARMQALIESADKLLDTFRQRFASVIAERPSTVAAKETGQMPIASDLARHIHDQADHH